MYYSIFEVNIIFILITSRSLRCKMGAVTKARCMLIFCKKNKKLKIIVLAFKNSEHEILFNFGKEEDDDDDDDIYFLTLVTIYRIQIN